MAEAAENLTDEENTETSDIDAEMRELLRDIDSRDENEVEDDGSEDVTEEVEPEEPEEPEVEDDSESEVEAEEEPEASDKTAEAETTEKKGPKRPPSSWSAKGKAEFSKLPEHIQDEVLKREDDFHKGIETYKEKADFGDKMRQIVQPYEPSIRARNSTPEQAVQNMLQTAYQLENSSPQQRSQLLLHVAQQYGADLEAMKGALSGEQQQQKDPYIQQLEQEVYNLKNNFQSQQNAAQQQKMSEAYSSIDAFRNEVDETGNPKHLYFDDVREQMADMIESAERSGKKLSLQDAYDAAVWSRPDLREVMLTQQQQQAAESEKAKRQKKTQKAKKRASPNVNTTGSYSESKKGKTGSIEDTMWATMQDIESRDD